jgi:hypothetical protein
MSTFLQLVNDVERESGTVQRAQRLSTVVNPPTDRQEKIVKWTAEAWRQIQTGRTDWPWQRGDFSHALVVGQKRYTADELGITDFSRWARPTQTFSPFSLYQTGEQANERDLVFISYERWRKDFDRGTPENNTPIYFSFDYDGRICVGPPPDRTYILRGEYTRGAQILVADNDVPRCAPQHHGTIVWKALLLLAENDEATIQIQTAQRNFTAGLRDLINDRDEAITL